MNAFQWLAISILSILLLIETVRMIADRTHWRGSTVSWSRLAGCRRGNPRPYAGA